jgi:hypothetical protein
MRQLLSFALLLLLVPHAVEAQLSTVSPWVVETINSRALGPRTIYIATPTGYDRANARYPVLVTLDANDLPQFRLWIAQTAYLAANSPGLPPMILVGIVNGSDRIHDLTPPATGSSVKDFKTAGGLRRSPSSSSAKYSRMSARCTAPCQPRFAPAILPAGFSRSTWPLGVLMCSRASLP